MQDALCGAQELAVMCTETVPWSTVLTVVKRGKRRTPQLTTLAWGSASDELILLRCIFIQPTSCLSSPVWSLIKERFPTLK